MVTISKILKVDYGYHPIKVQISEVPSDKFMGDKERKKERKKQKKNKNTPLHLGDFYEMTDH